MGDPTTSLTNLKIQQQNLCPLIDEVIQQYISEQKGETVVDTRALISKFLKAYPLIDSMDFDYDEVGYEKLITSM